MVSESETRGEGPPRELLRAIASADFGPEADSKVMQTALLDPKSLLASRTIRRERRQANRLQSRRRQVVSRHSHPIALNHRA